MVDKIRPFYNAKCLRCGKIEEEMVKIGALVFCNECSDYLFSTDDPVRQERDEYLKWLQKHHEECG